MDKGFYSKVNLEQLDAKRLKFIIPLSFRAKIATELAKSCGEDITSVANGFSFNGQVFFHTKIQVQVGTRSLIAHVYHGETRFEEKRFTDKTDAEDYIQESLKTKKQRVNLLSLLM